MAKLIKQISDLIALATDKGITGYYSDSQIMDVIDSVQMGLFRPLIQHFAKTKQIRNELLPFQVRASLTIVSKKSSLPGDFEHEIDSWVTVGGVDYEIRILESGVFRRRLRDPVDTPSTTNLIANIYNDSGKKIEISNQVTPIVFNYFKRPVKPVYVTNQNVGWSVPAITAWSNLGSGTSWAAGPPVTVSLVGTFISSKKWGTPLSIIVGYTYSFQCKFTLPGGINFFRIVTLDNSDAVVEILYNISGGEDTVINLSPTLAAVKIAFMAQSDDAGGTEVAQIDTFTLLNVSSPNQYIYDDVNSTDVEWSPLVHDILVERSLLMLGLAIRDGQVQRVGASPIIKESSTLS